MKRGYYIKKVTKSTMACVGYLSQNKKSLVAHKVPVRKRGVFNDEEANSIITEYNSDPLFYYFKCYEL